ncbi:hypothetical protein FKM82_022660 [Ascaphus truei]
MLRYKKHKRLTDGLGANGVGVMDDTDREVSSFTDRAFRSLSVAEEEQFNDHARLPSPIRGMPPSTKYHLGIFHLSVRKTKPLAQLPTLPGQQGKWAPTLQLLPNCVREGVIDGKTNIIKVTAPEPKCYGQRSKVSSLIKTFDNIENEQPHGSPFQSRLPIPKCSQNGKLSAEGGAPYDTTQQICTTNELPDSTSKGGVGSHDNRSIHRRTARDVFMESHADSCSVLSESPCSLGSPLLDPPKKAMKQKEPTRRSNFLHSENSAFKTWGDLNKRENGGDESESSLPGTPPALGSAASCSPPVPRVISGIRARETGLDVGWHSPASTASSSHEAVQNLRSVPPLPSKRAPVGKQSKEYAQRIGAQRLPLYTRIQEEEMQVDVGSPSSSKEHFNWNRDPRDMSISKPPAECKQEPITSQSTELVSNEPYSTTKRNEEVQARAVPLPQAKRPGGMDKGHELIVAAEVPSSFSTKKTVIQQVEKDSAGHVGSLCLSEQRHMVRKMPRESTTEPPPFTSGSVPPNSHPKPHGESHVPPWRRTKVTQRIEPGEKLLLATSPLHENILANKEDLPPAKPTSPSFNIIELLTPVIRRKNIQEALDEMPMMITPPAAEPLTTKEQESREVSLYRNRDDYKSKATSLLFNLKDVRKRMKSTYSPATSGRNGKNQAGDSRIQEDGNLSAAVLNFQKWATERENTTQTASMQNPRGMEKDNKTDFLGKSADNYLTLSSPQQVMESLVYENGDENRGSIQEEIHREINIPEERIVSARVNHLEQHIRKGADYPSLNIYHREDTDPNVELTEKNHLDPVLVQRIAEPLQPEENTIEESTANGGWGEAKELAPMDGNIVLEYNKERHIEDAPVCQEESYPSQELERHRSSESEEDGKREQSGNVAKDELQYYAVSSCGMEGNRDSADSETESERKGGESERKGGESERKGEENERKGEENESKGEEKESKGEEKETLASEEQNKEIVCNEELQITASIPSFKPNLFRIKDNTIRYSPVTRSVRPPLLRSLSEDSLVCRKEEVICRSKDRAEVKEARSVARESENVNADSGRTIRELLSRRPASETLKRGDTECNLEKKQREEAENLELWKKLCSLNANWRNTEKDKIETAKTEASCNDTSSPGLEGPFFHPVETCVSEVTGPSPECNTLLAQNISESQEDMMNGECVSSPLLTAESTLYSPLDSSPLPFEDAVAFSEETACSTITSPMSESLTCSMVTSPMSMNTQSSGFTTAFSGLEDLPSPTSAGATSRNGAFPFPTPEKSVFALPGSMESQTTELTGHPRERAPAVDLKMMHAGKPPAVPPKTEKALRRAKRLTKKRRKTDGPLKMHDGEIHEPELILDVPSPGNVTPTLMMPPAHFKVVSCPPRQEGSLSASSTPSFPVTQRKLLQDPDSGQYFVVDIPVHFRVKTFYDPETGKYLQVSLPPSERETQTLDEPSSPFLLYPGLAPLPASSITSLKDPSQLSANGGLDKGERMESWGEREEEEEDGNFSRGHRYIESAFDSRDQSMAGTPQSMDRTPSRSKSPDIILMKDLDDFAVEGIS